MAVDGITATYVAANQFSVAGNQTADFHAGRRVKAELTGGNVYSTISGSVFAAGTTVTLYDSELDNTLTKVWYGIGWGSVGSLPDHVHDGSEGSGGDFNFLARDGSTQLTGDWDFGSFTISGTGDIWCNDLHTVGSSLYIGDFKFQKWGLVPTAISGSGGMILGGSLFTGGEQLAVNHNNTGNRYAYIDFVGDDTYIDYGLRLIRYNTGPNANSELISRGTGDMLFNFLDGGGEYRFRFSGSSMMRLDTTGLIVGDAIDQAPGYALHVLDSWGIIGLEAEPSADAGIRLINAGSTKWHIYNDYTGAGEADLLRVGADGASWDSLRISNANYGVGIGMTGTNVPGATRLSLVADTAVALLIMYQYVGTQSGAAFSGYKARGDDQNSPTVVVADDVITGYNAFAYDGSAFDLVGRCRHRVESISSGDVASYWELYTSDTSGVNREVMRADSTGRLYLYENGITVTGTVGINVDLGDTDNQLHVYGSSAFDGVKVEVADSASGGAQVIFSAGSEPAASQGAVLQLNTASHSTDPDMFIIHNRVDGPIRFGTNNTVNYWMETDGTFRPAVSGTQNLGTVSYPFDEIHCNDIFTASGTVYIGNEQISSPSGALDFGDADFQSIGHMAVGNDADIDFPGFPTFEVLLNMAENFDASIVGAYGINLFARGAADSGSATVRGISANTIHTGSGQFGTLRSVYGAAYTNTAGATGTNIQGIYGNAYLGESTTTVTNLIGGYFTAGAVFGMTNASGINVTAGQFKVLALGTGDFSAENVYGVHVVKPGASYNGTLTNLYGLYIEDMTASSMTFTNEYNIYSAGIGSQNYFEGDIVVSGTIYSEDILYGANTISGTGDIYCTDLFASASSIHLGDLDLSYDGFALDVPAHLIVGGDVKFDVDLIPTISGTSKLGHPDTPLAEIFLVDTLTGDPYSITVASGIVTAIPV